MSEPALEITVKIGCSNWCKCCPQFQLINKYNDKNKTLSVDNFKKILSNVPKNVMVLFSGFCETFLNLQATEMIVYSIESGYPTSLYTTLVGACEADFKKLAGKKLIDCVIHSPDDIYFIYDYNKWKLQYSLFKLYKIPHKLMSLGPTKILGAIQHSPHNRAGNVVDLPINNVEGKIGCSVSNIRKLDNNIVLPNGDVYLCCMNYDLSQKLGNLLEENWDEIHSGKNYQQIISLMNEEKSDILCRKCHAVVKI